MNKRVVIILVAILVVLLAAIAVIELIKPKDNNGPDNLIVNSNGETGVVVDLETGSIVEDSSGIENVVTDDKVLGNEVVGEQNMSDADKDKTSSDKANSSSDKTSESSSNDSQTSSTDSDKQSMEGFTPWR